MLRCIHLYRRGLWNVGISGYSVRVNENGLFLGIMVRVRANPFGKIFSSISLFSFFGLVLSFSTITFLTFFILSSEVEFAIFVKEVGIIMCTQIYLSGLIGSCFFLYLSIFTFTFTSIFISISLHFYQETTIVTINPNFSYH